MPCGVRLTEGLGVGIESLPDVVSSQVIKGHELNSTFVNIWHGSRERSNMRQNPSVAVVRRQQFGDSVWRHSVKVLSRDDLRIAQWTDAVDNFCHPRHRF